MPEISVTDWTGSVIFYGLGQHFSGKITVTGWVGLGQRPHLDSTRTQQYVAYISMCVRTAPRYFEVRYIYIIYIYILYIHIHEGNPTMCAPATNSDLCQQITNMSMPIVVQAPSLETTGHVYQDTEAFSHKLGNNWAYV